MKRKVKLQSRIAFDTSQLKFKYLECIECGTNIKVDIDTITVRCGYCNDKMCNIDVAESKRTDRFRGWHLMAEFVDTDGNVYHKGIEQPDLRGTKPPTDIEFIKKTQHEKHMIVKKIKVERAEKNELDLVKEYKKKKTILKQAKLEKETLFDKQSATENVKIVKSKPIKSTIIKKVNTSDIKKPEIIKLTTPVETISNKDKKSKSQLTTKIKVKPIVKKIVREKSKVTNIKPIKGKLTVLFSEEFKKTVDKLSIADSKKLYKEYINNNKKLTQKILNEFNITRNTAEKIISKRGI